MAILNLTGMRSGGGASGWTDVTSLFVCEDGETPVSDYAEFFEAFTNGSLVWISMYILDFTQIDNALICMPEEVRPLITPGDTVGLVMNSNDNTVTPILFDGYNLTPENSDMTASGTIIYPVGQ